MSYLVRNLFLIFLITFLIIFFSPSFFYSLEADSISYIAKNSSRLSIYPTIIEIFGKNSLNHLFYFQTVIFSISLTFLSYCLQKSKIKIKLIIIFHLLILLNFLYTSFCKVVLTECLFFSMINFMVGLILIINFEEKKKIIFILLGFVAGFLISLKPEGIVLALSILIFPVFLVKKKMQNLVIVLLAMLIMPTTENFLYFQNHEKRETIFKHSVAGKIFMISGSDDFKIDNFPFFSEDLLKKISSESKKVRMSVAKIDNFYLRSKLLVDYEVVAQFQSDKILLNYIDEFVKTLDKDYIKIFYLIYKHPLNILSCR